MNLRELRAPEQILAITELIYAAALEPARWTEALDAMKEAVGGAAVSLRVESFEPASVRQTWLGFEPAFEKAYLEHYWRDDACHAGWPIGSTATADALVPVETRRSGALFNELFVPFQLDDLVGGLVEVSPSGTVSLAIVKARARRAFDETHTALLDSVLPHLRRAVRINAALQSAESERAFAWDVLDRLPVGLFAVDASARVVHANRAGERMLGDGLRVGRDGLVAELPAATRALRECLVAARVPATEREREGDATPIAVALPRRGGSPLSAVVMPARGAPLGLGSAPVEALLVVTDPNARVEPPAALLVRVYGLTATEARVALLIGRGLAPKEVANELGTAWNTVRFQLRQIYAKTRTTGQSGLVRLLALLGIVGER